MKPLVTIGLPLCKRLEYLPNVLRVIEAQDYPAIDLLISDNGLNGTKIQEIVDRHYSKANRFRQNPATVGICEHFNQLIDSANGEYYMMLADDDEVTPNYVSELVNRLIGSPSAFLGVARQQSIDKQGIVLRESSANIPQFLSGPDFIRGTWKTHEFDFQCLGTFMAKTAVLRECGGFPNFTRGYAVDNALLIKLCLKGDVAFSPNSAFRWRVDASSYGWSSPIADLARACRQYMHWMERDATVIHYAATNPAVWSELKEALIHNELLTYFWRWRDVYSHRLSFTQWVRAAFEMPYSYFYYRNVASVFARRVRAHLDRLFRSDLLERQQRQAAPFRVGDGDGHRPIESAKDALTQNLIDSQ
jgi:GT2 family glycosyltransferase